VSKISIASLGTRSSLYRFGPFSVFDIDSRSEPFNDLSLLFAQLHSAQQAPANLSRRRPCVLEETPSSDKPNPFQTA